MLSKLLRTDMSNLSAGALDTLRSDGAFDVQTNPQSEDYTLALSDRGKSVDVNATIAVVVPVSAVVAFPVGTVVSVCNVSAGTATIVGATGVTLVKAGIGTGDATLASGGVCTLRKTAADQWAIIGSGLS